MHELLEKLNAAAKKARDLAAQVEESDRAFTDEEKTQINGYLTEAKGYKDQLAKRAADDDLRKAIAELGGSLTDTSPQGQQAAAREIAAKGSLGTQFTESPIFKGWLKTFSHDGHIPDSAKVQGPPVPVDTKALITGLSSTSAGALIVNDRFPDVTPFLRRPLSFRDVVTTGTTTSDAIDWVTVNTETNNAAIVAEATSQADGTKPESTFTFTTSTETVRTIAHWLAVTKRALSDAGQIRTMIDSFLEDGLLQVLEDQMATGNGIGQNMVGLANISGIQTQAFNTDLPGTYRRAKLLVQTVGRDRANAYLLNPTDLMNLDLLTDNEQRYYFGGPADGGVPKLWGLPVVENEAIPAGTAYVGNFKQLVLLDREQTTISVSDSHANFFIQNLVAILAELRAMFLCRRPKSLVKIALA